MQNCWSLPRLGARSEIEVKAIRKGCGLVMLKPNFNKKQLSAEILPPWLQTISFKPSGTKNQTIQITDFFKMSDKVRLKNLYFSAQNISKVRAVFRKEEEEKKVLKRKRAFQKLIKINTKEYAKIEKVPNKQELNQYLRIDSLTGKCIKNNSQ